ESRRALAGPPETMYALPRHRAAQAEQRLRLGPAWPKDVPDLVFRSSTGGPVNEKNLVRRHFKALLEKAVIPAHHRLYDLRHTCATLLLFQGEHPKVVAERLGHVDTNLTLDTYTHVLPGMQRVASDNLASL